MLVKRRTPTFERRGAGALGVQCRLIGYSRNFHDGLVLDDVRDLQFVVEHQEKLQGKYNGVVEFASTAGGTCAFWKDLWKVPVVLTVNNSTRNLNFLVTDDLCSKQENVVFLSFPSRPGEAEPSTSWSLA